MSDEKKEDAPKKKGGMMKMVMLGVGGLVLVGGGVAGGVYAASGHAAVDHSPKLVPKSEEKRLSGASDGEGKGGKATPPGTGGDQYASNYYTLDKEFTSNLQDSVHFIQVGLAISTPYDATVIDNLKTHEIAVRSAILLELGNTTEDGVFTSDGKRQLQARLTKAINNVLIQKEGFGGVGNVYFTSFVVQ
jgi:flagellar protein FliL